MKFIRPLLISATLALSVFSAGDALAIPSCGTNCTSTSPNPHGYTSTTPTNCYSCHKSSTTPGGGISSSMSSGILTVRPTTESCGSCVIGTAPAGVPAHINVTPTTVCSICHISTYGNTSRSSSGTIGIYPTTQSCGACVIGTAPSSVSAHKNVNMKEIVCAVCHTANSTVGSTSTGGSGNTSGNHNRYDDQHLDGRPPRNPQDSPGNSAFGHSHKQDKKSNRDRDD